MPNRIVLAGMFALTLFFAPLPIPLQAGQWESTVADNLYRLLTAHRQQHNLPPLERNDQLARAAQSLSNHMAATGLFNHEADGRTYEQRMEAEGYDACSSAENILQNHKGNPARIAKSMMAQWTTSPDHNSDMLGDYAEVGIGVAVASDGRAYATQVFGTRC